MNFFNHIAQCKARTIDLKGWPSLSEGDCLNDRCHFWSITKFGARALKETETETDQKLCSLRVAY